MDISQKNRLMVYLSIQKDAIHLSLRNEYKKWNTGDAIRFYIDFGVEKLHISWKWDNSRTNQIMVHLLFQKKAIDLSSWNKYEN